MMEMLCVARDMGLVCSDVEKTRCLTVESGPWAKDMARSVSLQSSWDDIVSRNTEM